MDVRYRQLKTLLFEAEYDANTTVESALKKGFCKLTDAQFRRVQNADECRKALRQVIVKAGLLTEYLEYEFDRNHAGDTGTTQQKGSETE